MLGSGHSGVVGVRTPRCRLLSTGPAGARVQRSAGSREEQTPARPDQRCAKLRSLALSLAVRFKYAPLPAGNMIATCPVGDCITLHWHRQYRALLRVDLSAQAQTQTRADVAPCMT